MDSLPALPGRPFLAPTSGFPWWTSVGRQILGFCWQENPLLRESSLAVPSDDLPLTCTDALRAAFGRLMAPNLAISGRFKTLFTSA